MTRKRKTARQVKYKTLGDVCEAMKRLQAAEIERDRLTVEMEESLTWLRHSYAAELERQENAVKMERKGIESWLTQHKDEFKPLPRSRVLDAGTIGFRRGKRRLKPLSKWTWKKVLAEMCAAGVRDYLRVKRDVDREAVLADAKKLGDERLRSWGLRVIQDDKPFVEINREPKGATHGTEEKTEG